MLLNAPDKLIWELQLSSSPQHLNQGLPRPINVLSNVTVASSHQSCLMHLTRKYSVPNITLRSELTFGWKGTLRSELTFGWKGKFTTARWEYFFPQRFWLFWKGAFSPDPPPPPYNAPLCLGYVPQCTRIGWGFCQSSIFWDGENFPEKDGGVWGKSDFCGEKENAGGEKIHHYSEWVICF